MRRSAFLILSLIAVLAAACALPWGMPTAELVPVPAEQDSGTVWVAENRWLTSRIYALRGGFVSELYEELRLRDGREYRVAQVAAAENTVRFVRTAADGSSWELAELEKGQAKVVCQGSLAEPAAVTGLRMGGQYVWLTAVSEGGDILIYEYTPASGASLQLRMPAEWLPDTVTAEYNGERVQATTRYGDTWFLSSTGEKSYVSNVSKPVPPAAKVEGMGWLLCKRTVLLAGFVLWLAVAAVVLAAAGINRRAKRVAVRLTASGGAVVLLALSASAGGVIAAVASCIGLEPAWRALPLAAGAAAVVWLLSLLILWGTARKVTQPLKTMRQQMERVAEGNFMPWEAPSGLDELSSMDRSMQEMCMSLSVRNYETHCTIQSYRRFAPMWMVEFLDRPSVAEVDLGDSRRITGCLGLFSIGNQAEARAQLEDAAFVDFINHSFGTLYDCVRENHGGLINSGLRLSSMEAAFSTAADGVRAGLDFLGKIQVEQDSGIPVPRACLILHRTSFLYGIVGREEQLFPYLSSAEMEFLNGFAPSLDAAGVRMVATEAYWKQLKNEDFTGRCIGFVSSGEKFGAYRLYEILDAYPELEREVRRDYDARFQEALNLFYHSDFYLARNLFSALLRACPSDGVVRWYLFACERFFNQEQEEGAEDYSLFGIEA